MQSSITHSWQKGRSSRHKASEYFSDQIGLSQDWRFRSFKSSRKYYIKNQNS